MTVIMEEEEDDSQHHHDLMIITHSLNHRPVYLLSTQVDTGNKELNPTTSPIPNSTITGDSTSIYISNKMPPSIHLTKTKSYSLWDSWLKESQWAGKNIGWRKRIKEAAQDMDYGQISLKSWRCTLLMKTGPESKKTSYSNWDGTRRRQWEIGSNNSKTWPTKQTLWDNIELSFVF